MALLDIYKAAKDECEKKLAALYTEWQNAGVATAGDYKNKITGIESEIEELKIKIAKEARLAEEQGKEVNMPTILIYVITGTNNRIQRALTEEEMCTIYLAVKPLNHDDQDRRKWMPFSRETISIKDLLDELRAEGYRFDAYYMDGYTYAQYVAEGYPFAKNEATLEADIFGFIDDNIKNIITIVDLLAMDEENVAIAQRFDRKDALHIITPICPYLPNELKAYMEEKRKEAFKNLQHKTLNSFYAGLDDASAKMFLKKDLTQIIKKETPSFNTFKGMSERLPLSINSSI